VSCIPTTTSLPSSRRTDAPSKGSSPETVRRRDQALGLYDDAAKVAAIASKLTGEGKDLVLVPHSYVRWARPVRALKAGKQGGIVRIVFVTAVVGKEGRSLLDVMGETRLDTLPSRCVRSIRAVSGPNVSSKGECMVMDPAGCAPVVFSDLPHEEGLTWASKMPTHSAISFGQKLTYAAYKEIPTSYLFCKQTSA
jgi:hypothetical protein